MAFAIACALAITPAAALAQPVVINEVMYRPWNESTYGRYEFIELYNAGETAEDLSGVLLTDSSDLTGICHFHQPADKEGVYQLPPGTILGPGEHLALWHTHIPGVTDQPGNLVYDTFLYFGNLVLANGGDQVTLFTCDAGAPVIIDALDYSTFDLETFHNRSLERISALDPTQEEANWGYTTAPGGGQLPGGAYMPGGTPGAANTLSGP